MSCDLSLVIGAYNMARELPRTLISLSRGFQRGVEQLAYELIVMDNGSREPLDLGGLPAEARSVVRYHHIANAPSSPVAAVNEGIRLAQGALVGVMIDGARIASPGLLATASMASRVHPRAVVATLGFHLGPDVQMRSIRDGYDQQAEDRLLQEAGWIEDGYRLFAVAALAGSSAGGWFRPLAESNALFMSAALWQELGGLDERFRSPGGGVVNLDTYERACALPGSQLVVLLGEATFHQVHGGVATNARSEETVRGFFLEYERVRGRPFSVPDALPVYFGSIPPQCLPWIGHAVQAAHSARPD